MRNGQERDPARLREGEAVMHTVGRQGRGRGEGRKRTSRRISREGAERRLYLPLVKIPDQRLELELRHTGQADGVRVRSAPDGRRAGLVRSARRRKHGAEDEGVLGQEVPVNTEKTVLDLCGEKPHVPAG